MDLIESLEWRYATKKMDPTKTVPRAKLERILEATRLAPTSSGLQPFELIVVSSPEVRAKLKVAANGQSQITDASHVLVFAAWDTYTAERINAACDLVNETRGATSESGEKYRKFLLATYPARDAEVNFIHAAKQAYLALGVALVAAATEEVDSTPMEGFDPPAVDELLGLRARGLRSAALMAVGYRDAANDWLVNLKKVRRSHATFITEVT